MSSSPDEFVATTPLKPVTGLETTNTSPAGGDAVGPERTFCAVAEDGAKAPVRSANWCAYPFSFWSSWSSMVLPSVALVMTATMMRISDTNPITAVISRVCRLIGRLIIVAELTAEP
ncbi:hypothetical protein [Microbacterium sp.]|uniref:hypothetical protein n=1 Tax=Microbacterium sp. TaxID=51671 RepID=UPI003A926CA1